jgi:hypothetical protein
MNLQVDADISEKHAVFVFRGYIGPEGQGLREYGNWMQTNREPSGRLQGGGWVWSEKEKRGVCRDLVSGRFMFLRSRMRASMIY